MVGADGVAGEGVLQAHRRADVAGGDLRQLLPVVGVHPQQAAHALPVAPGHVAHGGAGLDGSRIDTQEHQPADVGVNHDLEGQGRQGFAVQGLADLDGFGAGDGAFDGRHVQGRRQVADDGVEQRVNALAAHRAAAQHRDQLPVDRGVAEGGTEVVGADVLALKVLDEQSLVRLDDLFDHFLAIVVVGLLVFGRNRHQFGGIGHVVAPIGIHDGLAFNQIDHAAKFVLGPDGHLHRNGVAFQPASNGLDGALVGSADPVHLVDEADAGNVVGVGLAPHGFRLGLHAGHGVQHHDAAVEDAQAPFHFGGEVHVAGGVDDVDLVVAPVGRGCGGGDGDAPFLLLRHPVHGRGALIHAADLADATGEVEHALGNRGLAGVDMGDEADVTYQIGVGCYGSHTCTWGESGE